MPPTTKRAAAARETRRRVVAAAHDLFLAQGFPDTTIREVADRAGVSQETVYKAFGSKGGLLKAAYDVAMAGDDEPVAIGDRPEYSRVWNAASPAEAVQAYAALAATLSGRAGPLTRVVLASRGASIQVEEFAATIDAERLVGSGMAVRHWGAAGWLRPGLDQEQARDILWTLISPAVYTLLTERGWTLPQYEAWLADAVGSLVLDAV